ncbi:hypothetical protein D3C87_1370330 [compost metagenome]
MRRQAQRHLGQYRNVPGLCQAELRRRQADQHGNGVFELGALPDQVDHVRFGTLELRLRLGHRVLAGHTGTVLVFGHFQGTSIRLDRRLQQPLLLVDHPQLQVVLHQFRLLAQAHRRQIGKTGLGIRGVGFKTPAQFAPDVRFPTDSGLSRVGVTNTAGRTGQAGTAAACALAGAVFAQGQVHRGEKRAPGTAHQRLGLTVLGFGLGDGLVGAVELLDQAIELLIAVQLPPRTAGQGVAWTGLTPTRRFLVLRRFRRLRALVIRADGAGAEQSCAQRQAQQPRASGSDQRCSQVEQRTVSHSGVSRAASVRTPRQ